MFKSANVKKIKKIKINRKIKNTLVKLNGKTQEYIN